MMVEWGWKVPTALKSERLPYSPDPWMGLGLVGRPVQAVTHLSSVCLPLMSALHVCFKGRHFLLFLHSLNNAVVCHTSSMIKTDKLWPL